MATGITFEGDQLKITDGAGATMSWPRGEITVVSVYAMDTIVDGVLPFITLDHESGHYVEANAQMEGWDTLLAGLPSFLGFDRASLESALARVSPDQDDVVVFERDG